MLLADTAPPEDKTSAPADMLPIDRIRANPDQPRRDFPPEDLEDLASSILRNGIIQPIVVRKDPGDPVYYQIVAGERRWRAAQRAQLHEMPVILRDLSDQEVLELAIIENIQRADLNPVEEAAGYRQLMDQYGHTQEQLAAALGKSRSHIANLMRLLNLPDDVLGYLRSGKISAGHARTLVGAPNASDLARQIIREGLSVRQTESLLRRPEKTATPQPRQADQKDADTRAIEADLTAHLRLKVSINHASGSESGQITIKYKNLDELDGLCQLLSQ